jgi:oligoribonuclease (3'-5' exoribonuclease)
MGQHHTWTGDGWAAVIDLETTGHDDERDPLASVLEVGVVLCRDSPDLPVVAEANLLIRPPGLLTDLDRLFAGMKPLVRAMHTSSGLWDEARGDNAWPIHDADRALADWLTGHVGDAQVPLLGSGVSHYDSRWLRQHLPRFAMHLTYWTLDCGVIRRALEAAGRPDLLDVARDVEAKPHRALGDAQLHAAETRRYLQLLAAIPAPEPVPSGA